MIYRFHRIQQRFCYEMLPMATSATQAFLHVIQYSVYNNNEITLLANYVQIVTFAFVGQSFMYIYYKLVLNDLTFRRDYRKYLSVTVALYGLVLLAQLISISIMDSRICSHSFYISLYLILSQLIATTSISTVYGTKLWIYIEQLQGSQETLLKDTSTILSAKLTQILRVMFSLIGSTIVFSSIIIYLLISDAPYLCDFNIKLDSSKNIIMAILTLTQIIPCFILPYMFYYSQVESSTSIGFEVSYSEDHGVPPREDDAFINRMTLSKQHQ